jgi:CubicO group peptidase (beta-lactamase class C family)
MRTAGPVDQDRLTDLMDRARREVESGTLPACQLAVALDGEVVAEATFGAPEASRFHGYSSGKVVVAGALWLLLGEGALGLEDRVADHIPEFGDNGKDDITLEQVLTHTSGFPRAPFDPLEWEDPEARRARFARWRTNWEPGTRFEYHPTSAHWVLADLIEAVSGQDWRRFLEQRLLDPLGLTRLRFGVAPEDQGDILDVVTVGDAPAPDELEALTGIAGLNLADFQGEVTDEALIGFNRPEIRAVGVPGGGVVTTAGDLALWYQALLHDPKGLWDADTLADATGHVRCTFADPMTSAPANRTIGVIVRGDDNLIHLRGMGRTVSARAFGHNGAGGQVAWGDPETGLSFAYLTNGLDRHPIASGRRGAALSNRAGALTGAAG